MIKLTASFQNTLTSSIEFKSMRSLELTNFSYSDDESPDNLNKANNVTIIGVQNFEVLYSCINCKTNMERSGSSNMILCHRCNTVQNLVDSKITAKLILRTSDGSRITLRAYTNILMDIVNNQDSSQPATIAMLLNSHPFNVEYNNFNVVQSIQR